MSEQLTRMDMELFVKAEPNQCLGSICSWRYNKGKPHLAPSIRVIMVHFNNVVSLVTTLCLGDLSMKASVRSRLLEFWIQVAEGCRFLRNFSSLHAIMSALQSRAIFCLHSSWQQVSRKDLFTFHKLAKITSPENNYSKSRELLLKENEILEQMKELQCSCCFYNIPVDHHFTEWFRGLERLSKDASYELSCALEPCRPTDCPSKNCSAIGKPGKNGASQPLQKTFLQRTKKKHKCASAFFAKKERAKTFIISRSGLNERRRGCLARVYPRWLRPVLCRCLRRLFRRTTQNEDGLAPGKEEACGSEVVQAGTPEEHVERLVLAQLIQDSIFIYNFLDTYSMFQDTQEVLDLLFQRFRTYEAPMATSGQKAALPHCSQEVIPRDQLCYAISGLINTWLDRRPQDFLEAAQHPCLQRLLVHLRLHMCGSELERGVSHLLAQLGIQESIQGEAVAPAAAPLVAVTPTPELDSAPCLKVAPSTLGGAPTAAQAEAPSALNPACRPLGAQPACVDEEPRATPALLPRPEEAGAAHGEASSSPTWASELSGQGPAAASAELEPSCSGAPGLSVGEPASPMARGPGADGAPAWSAADREPCASWAPVLPCSQPTFSAELPVFLILALALLLSGGPDLLLSAVGVLMLLLHAFRALNSCAKSESPTSLALVHSAQGAMGSSDDKEPSFPLSPRLSLKEPDSSAELEVLLTVGLLFYLLGAPAVVLFLVGVPTMVLAVVTVKACHADLEPSATWAQVHSVDGAPASRPAAEPQSSSAPGFSVGDAAPSAELDVSLPLAAMVSLVQTPVLALCVGAALYIVRLLVGAPISHTPSWSAQMGPDSTIVSDIRREDTAASGAEMECPRSSTPVLGLLSTAAGNTCAPVLAQDSAAAWRPQQESHNCLSRAKEQAPSASGHSELDWAAVPAQESFYRPVVSREPGCGQKVPPALIADPHRMSEQLTRMDMELFVKAEPNQCRVYIWSRRYRKGKPHLAPSILAILIHFNNVVSLVKTLCLGDLSMKASVRARLLEFWIQVAEGCRVLKNFSSLHAIMSALQSRSIWHLHSCWQQVSRKDLFTFHKLAKITSPENNYSKSRELLLKETGKLAAKEKLLNEGPRQSQKMAMSKGIIPYLRIILKDFSLIQLDYENTKDERSEEKKLIKENEILEQMKELQHSCRFYNIPVDHHFTEWFRGLERLGRVASYELSYDLEPCSPTGSPRKKYSRIGNAGKNGGSQTIQKTFPPRTKKKHRVRFSLPPT